MNMRFTRLFQTLMESVSDEEYLKAVEAGDMEVVQKMVDEKAKSLYLIRSKHATGVKFTIFDRTKIPSYDPDTNIRGFHFSNEADTTSSYHYQNTKNNHLMEVFLNLKTTISRRDAERMVKNGNHVDYFPDGFDTVIFSESSGTPTSQQRDDYNNNKNVNLANGYFIRKNNDDGGADLFHKSAPFEMITGYSDLDDAFEQHQEEHYIIRSPNQIKLADPITYDDSGNIIPLSKRFNPASDDIRY